MKYFNFTLFKKGLLIRLAMTSLALTLGCSNKNEIQPSQAPLAKEAQAPFAKELQGTWHDFNIEYRDEAAHSKNGFYDQEEWAQASLANEFQDIWGGVNIERRNKTTHSKNESDEQEKWIQALLGKHAAQQFIDQNPNLKNAYKRILHITSHDVHFKCLLVDDSIIDSFQISPFIISHLREGKYSIIDDQLVLTLPNGPIDQDVSQSNAGNETTVKMTFIKSSDE